MSDFGWKHLTREDRAVIARGVRDGKAYGGPFHVELHPADRCNIACFFCSTAAIRGKDELDLGRMIEIFDELKALGTRSVRLAGGGEPLFHRKTKDYLAALAERSIPVENVTTNGVLLDDRVAELLIAGADHVTISLNTGDAASYAAMMKTPERQFDRVLANVRNLMTRKRAVRSRRPEVRLQFLVWKGNFRTVREMYRLARELDVDAIVFNGLSHLSEADRMTDEEHAALIADYEALIAIDGFRRIRTIDSFERDISSEIAAAGASVRDRRRQQPVLSRLRDYVAGDDFSVRERVSHTLRFNLQRLEDRLAPEVVMDECVFPWHSMLIRSTGDVAPCCIMQGKKLGNVLQSPVADVWNGPVFQQFRDEMREVIERRGAWTGSETSIAETACASGTAHGCPIRSFYHRADRRFQAAFRA